jgi:hypothetical protein
MRNRDLVIIAALLASGVAQAADLPLKAVAPRAPVFYGGSGFYCGAGVGGEATKVSGNLAATYEAAGLANFNCGYAMAIADDRFLAFQANYAYSNIDNRTIMGEIGPRQQSGDFKVMYGAPISALSGLFSNAAAGFPALPPIPVGAINSTAHPYVSAGVRITQERTLFAAPDLDAIIVRNKTSVKGLLGVGMIYQANSNTTVNTFVDWKFGSGKFLLQPGTEIEVGSTFRTGVIVNYGMGG